MLTIFSVKSIFRLAILSLLVYQLGVYADIRWHYYNPIRDDYFIVPHIIMYFGVIATLFCALILKLRGVGISYYVFLVFPILSIFDELWHRFFGVELYTSPMMFWSPAHFLFGFALIYIIYMFLRLKIEANVYLLSFIQAWFLILIWRLARYLLVPLSPFSIYTDLHTIYNILVPIFLYLFLLSLTKIVKNNLILLPFILLSAVASSSVSDFITGGDRILGTFKLFFLSPFRLCCWPCQKNIC